MLRRSQSVAPRRDLPDAEEVEAGFERLVAARPTDRRQEDRRKEDRRQTDRRQSDRREGERRGMEQLRAEALQAVISRVEDRNFNGLRETFSWRPRLAIPRSRLILLVIALAAGGLAAFLATHRDEAPLAVAAPTSAASEPAPIAMARILAATAPIAAGERLTAANVGWVDWPAANLPDDSVTAADHPEAVKELSGSAARSDILAGDPIRMARLAAADGSFLAAILPPGMRAVSVSVAADSASGGFVAPNDRVDVVLTVASDNTRDVETILTDVQVIALNGRLGRGAPDAPPPAEDAAASQSSETFANTAIATLALDSQQAELVIAATSMGKLSLVLRPAGSTPLDPAQAASRTSNATIRLTSPFWTGKTTGQ